MKQASGIFGAHEGPKPSFKALQVRREKGLLVLAYLLAV